jgi:hypothetical protein
MPVNSSTSDENSIEKLNMVGESTLTLNEINPSRKGQTLAKMQLTGEVSR